MSIPQQRTDIQHFTVLQEPVRLAMVKILVERGAAINCCNVRFKYRRPIHEAILGKHTEVIALLLQASADITSPDGNGRTIADYLAVSNEVEVIRGFMNAIPENTAEEYSVLLVMPAIMAGAASILSWVFSKYPETLRKVPWSGYLYNLPIHYAITRGGLQVLELVLASYRELNNPDPRVARSISHGLVEAARRDTIDMMRVLLEYDNKVVNFVATGSNTAWCEAAWRGETRKLALLLGHPDCNVNVRSSWHSGKSSALHLVARKGHLEAVELLLGQDEIDIHLKDGSRQIAAEVAFWARKWDVLQLLAKRTGFDTHEARLHDKKHDWSDPDEFWSLAMHFLKHKIVSSSSREWDDIVQTWAMSDGTSFASLLLNQSDFDVNRLSWQGDYYGTALHHAAQHHRHDVFRLFLSHAKIDVNERYPYSRGGDDSVLHLAVRHNNMTAFSLLLDRPEINLTVRNYDHLTALELAKTLGRSEMCDLISRRLDGALLEDKRSINN
ncbi:ankyrin [Setomelanomma holmii]|uniref:Ankyrin n=1 Tax=Setomelanomma holmii TaxID=210430 RepID=A0A9P4H684_9PLEO|nr:ankyrin [Setomelanomma holmii]